MSFRNTLPVILGSTAMATGQSPSPGTTASKAIVTNLGTARWAQEKGDSSSVMLHEDATTGGMDLLVRFPAGHVIAPHWHDSNERIIVLEGQLTLRQDNGDAVLNVGGFAFLPAHEVQRLSCSAKTRCTFYLAWDGKPASHAAR
jgi:quercetin dioxygenase-like cupin family protein